MALFSKKNILDPDLIISEEMFNLSLKIAALSFGFDIEPKDNTDFSEIYNKILKDNCNGTIQQEEHK